MYEASLDSAGRATVTYMFEDGSSVEIPMCNANYTSATDNSEEPDNGAAGTGDVWIVDTGNAKAL